ncbi:MAG: hypothetical protein K1X77_03910 [Bacteroidia bacterium]|nr:hypothetical protein [Bacteroidia bacterium]
MHGSKLILLLKTLNKKEIKDFQLFAGASFFNKNEKLQVFLEHLSGFHPQFEQEQLEKTLFFKKFYPKETYSDQKIRYLLSDLTKLLEDFIAYQEYQKDAFRKKYHLASGLLERNQDKFFLQELESLQQMNAGNQMRDHAYYFNQQQISEISYEHTSEKRNRAFDSSLQALIDNLEIAYLVKGLRFYCEMINRRNILSVEYNLRFFDQVMQYIRQGQFDDIPAIRIYKMIYISLTEAGNHENYLALLDELAKSSQLFSSRELRGMYVFAQNDCIRRINRGDKGALNEIFFLYQTMVSQGLIYEGQFVSQPDFKNIVTTGLRLGEVAWVSDFIARYKEKLNPEYSENAFTYSMAWVHFARKEYDKALRMLLRVEFNDVYYHLDSKSLLMKVYFELDEYEAFLSLTDAFKVYLKRNRFISESQRTTYSNFIKLIYKLIRVKLGKETMGLPIHQEILSTKPAADLAWLEQKSIELLTKHRIKLPEDFS